MKALKCPECEEVSTFTCGWTGTTQYWAPLTVDNGGDVQIDYDKADNSGEDEDDWEEGDCDCGKCGAKVPIDNLEVVDVEQGVAAE
jgi:hypothetical protein